QGVLVHEVDEGQPCLTCKDKCPGFSPHLWSVTLNQGDCGLETKDLHGTNNVISKFTLCVSKFQLISTERSEKEKFLSHKTPATSPTFRKHSAQLPRPVFPAFQRPPSQPRPRPTLFALQSTLFHVLT
ncbi:unnamed protein product, partial [Ixodes persulcatus]